MRESAIVTYRENIIDYSIGTENSVEFNFERIWAYIKEIPDFDKRELEFFHVHPQGFARFSDTDYNCMQGLNLALGIPIRFCVIVFVNADLFSMAIGMKWAIYDRGEKNLYNIRIPSHNELLFLKYLAYGTNDLWNFFSTEPNAII